MISKMNALLKTVLLSIMMMLLNSCTALPFEDWSNKSKCEKIAEVSIVAGAVILAGLVGNDQISEEAAYSGAIVGGFSAGSACK